MKKTLFIGSLLLVASGWGFHSLVTPVVAKPATAVQSSTPTVKPVSKLQLLSAGAQPQQQLRFKPAANLKEVATLTLDMDMKMAIAGNTVPSKLPSTTMKMETVVTKIDSNGDIHYKFRYTDVDVTGNGALPPAAINQLRAQMKKMVGLNGSFVVNDRGLTKSGSFVVPQGVDPTTKQMLEQMSQSLEQFSAPVPDVPVGIGAKWRVAMPVDAGGIKLMQTGTYELVSLKDGVATLKVGVEQQAKSQRLRQAGMPKGFDLTLKSLTSTGQGQTILRFDRLLPPSATLSMTSTSQMQTSSPQLPKPMMFESEAQMQLTLQAK